MGSSIWALPLMVFVDVFSIKPKDLLNTGLVFSETVTGDVL